eukprot:gene6547-22039_t
MAGYGALPFFADHMTLNSAEYRDDLQLTAVYRPAGMANSRLGTIAFDYIHLHPWTYTSQMVHGECFNAADELNDVKELVILEQVPRCLRDRLRHVDCSYTVERRFSGLPVTGATTALAMWRVGFDRDVVRRVLQMCTQGPDYCQYVSCIDRVRMLPTPLCRFPSNPWSPIGFVPPRSTLHIWPDCVRSLWMW